MEQDIEGRLSRSQTISILLIGVVGTFILLVQPMLLNGAARLGRISMGEMGYAAMIEATGIAVTVGWASLFLKPRHVRAITAAALVTAMLVNIAALYLSNGAFLASRLLAGVAGGTLLWVWVGMLARAEVPGRLIGIYVALQAILLLILSSLLTSPSIGLEAGTAGYIIMAALFGSALLLLPLMPDRYRDLAVGTKTGLPPIAGVCGLMATGLYLGAIMGLWIYILPVVKSLGFSEVTGGLALSIGVGLQIPAALTATVLADKLAPLPVFLGSIAINIIAIGLAMTTGSSVLFIAAIGVFGFLWTFAPPFHMPYLIQIDPSRRAAMQLPTSQLVGSAVGPAIASVAVEHGGVTAAPLASALMFVGAVLAIALAAFVRKRVDIIAMER